MNDQQIAQTKVQIRQLSFKIAGKTQKINHLIAKKRRARSTGSKARIEARIERMQRLKGKLEEKASILQKKIPKPVFLRRRNGQTARCVGCGKPINVHDADWRASQNFAIEIPAIQESGNGQWYEKYVHAFCLETLDKRVAARKAGAKT